MSTNVDAVHCVVFIFPYKNAAAPLGLKISWEKTKLQNLGSDPQPTNISVDSNLVDSVDSFVYLGCLQSSSAAPTSNAASDMPHRPCRHCPGSGKTNV